MYSQERLYQEVCSAVGLDYDVTLEDLNKMPYLDQVIKETLRWFILVPYIMRRAGKDINISKYCKIDIHYLVNIAIFVAYVYIEHSVYYKIKIWRNVLGEHFNPYYCFSRLNSMGLRNTLFLLDTLEPPW